MNTLFVLTIIIIFVVVILSRNTAEALLLIFLLVNAAIIVAMLDANRVEITPAAVDPTSGPTGDDQQQAAAGANDGPKEGEKQEMYGPFYENWHGHHNDYNDCYGPLSPAIGGNCAQNTFSIDSNIVNTARARAREKKCIDGLVTKNADYYAYHFAGELEAEEKKPWWGRAEY